jgi:tetratricopeptide (TPR) repeat protein
MQQNPLYSRIIKTTIALYLCFLGLTLTGCSTVVSNAKQDFADNLSATISESDDPETIEQALPAYMVLVSSMIRSDPDNVDLLLSGANLYTSYASVFVENKQRQRVLAQHAYDYASHALCIQKPATCGATKESYHQYEQTLKLFTKADVKLLFTFGSAWAGLIEANSSDWNAVADLPRVKSVLERVVQLDENVNDGNAHVYLGVLDSLLPPAMGGKPELAKAHFEKAIEISHGANLMAKVLYAEKYARLVFNRELHDKLLREVVAADISHSSHRLVDVLAQQRARKLLANASDYF